MKKGISKNPTDWGLTINVIRPNKSTITAEINPIVLWWLLIFPHILVGFG